MRVHMIVVPQHYTFEIKDVDLDRNVYPSGV